MTEPSVEEIAGAWMHETANLGEGDYEVRSDWLRTLIASWRERGEAPGKVREEIASELDILAALRQRDAEATKAERERIAVFLEDAAQREGNDGTAYTLRFAASAIRASEPER